MTDTVYYLSENSVATLLSNIEKNKDCYFSTIKSFTDMVKIKKSSISCTGSLSLTSYAPEDDKENALKVYENLKNLSPKQASDERVWAYMTHIEAKDYTYNRWIKGSSEEDVKRRIASRYFLPDIRSLKSRNAISRLWWLGHAAHKVTPDAPNEFLEVMLLEQDIFASVFERPTMETNIGILTCIYKRLRESFEKGDGLLKREAYREWLKRLNFEGGVRLLDALSPEQLQQLVNDLAKNAIEKMN
ncbi:MAG: hypothetical protein GDA50_03525 [Alphaproteobacteria bacterium GM202ARS2]|nr:hypothetical protein [Alphaproteobacteria bacterium GM202ARS2]